ncbi:hypothetical protein KR093_001362 [Drosophila rubida]|uniref:RWD domain-containing protein n=1 Tax=Drosophila rubida TaxID=30044 RepID=A0AAD4K5Z8_9MUSC|nr:hypothetical protein KR093_001362 [Drosophila rubida]
MDFIAHELSDIRANCSQQSSKLISCNATLVRIDLFPEQQNRSMTVCLRFPEDYPQRSSILVELKSRVYSDKLLAELTRLMDEHAKQHLGKAQALLVLKFAIQYLTDNPLCICLDEIKQLRQDLKEHNNVSQLKLRQRTSCVELTARGGQYFYRLTAAVPDDYPQQAIELRGQESNLPNVLLRYLNGQSREIARQCVEPPLRLGKDELANFRPSKSLYRTLKFCLEATRDFHLELCPICDNPVLPEKPETVVLDDRDDAYVERVYCGHLFHQGCLKLYLAEPPFPKGGKLCPAKRRHPRSDARSYMGKGAMTSTANKLDNNDNRCGIKLAHDRWVVSVKTAEARWAQKQARQRELEEVVDFLQ